MIQRCSLKEILPLTCKLTTFSAGLALIGGGIFSYFYLGWGWKALVAFETSGSVLPASVIFYEFISFLRGEKEIVPVGIEQLDETDAPPLILREETPQDESNSESYKEAFNKGIFTKATEFAEAHGVDAVINEQEDTLLHAAAKYGNGALIDLLLAKGAGNAIENVQGNTPLHYAAEFQKHEIFEKLANRNPDALKKKNNAGETPLDVAEKMGSPLLKKKYTYGEGALIRENVLAALYCTQNGNKGGLYYFLKANAEGKKCKSEEFTEIARRSDVEHKGLIYFLIEEASEEEIAYCDENENLLLLAIDSNVNTDALQALVNRGAGIKLSEGTILHTLSARSLPIDLFRLLVEAGQKEGALDIRDNDGNTLLHLYQEDLYQQALLEAEANPNIPNNNGETAIQKIVHHSEYSKDTLRLFLLKAPAQTFIPPQTEDPLLHRLFKDSHYGAEFILSILDNPQFETIVNLKDQSGCTLLYLVLNTPDVNSDLAEKLIDQGASLTTETNDHDTPLNAARRNCTKKAEFLQYLSEMAGEA